MKTALSHFNFQNAQEWRDRLIASHAIRAGARPPAMDDIAARPTAQARINHDRWLAHCPFCAGAELVDPSIGLFYCLSCFNARVGGRFVKVRFPKAREAIEKLLSVRVNDANRNWEPWETIDDLRKENEREGVS